MDKREMGDKISGERLRSEGERDNEDEKERETSRRLPFEETIAGIICHCNTNTLFAFHSLCHSHTYRAEEQLTRNSLNSKVGSERVTVSARAVIS